MVDVFSCHLDIPVGEDEAWSIFRDARPDSFDVRLAQRVARPRPDVGIKGAALKQVACEIPCSLAAADIERVDLAENPTRNDKERKFADVMRSTAS
jgi:hypothetical protein